MIFSATVALPRTQPGGEEKSGPRKPRSRSPTGSALTEQTVTDVAISALTVVELEYGVARSRQPALNRTKLDGFLQPLQVVAFDDAAAAAYGPIRATLEARGQIIGP